MLRKDPALGHPSGLPSSPLPLAAWGVNFVHTPALRGTGSPPLQEVKKDCIQTRAERFKKTYRINRSTKGEARFVVILVFLV